MRCGSRAESLPHQLIFSLSCVAFSLSCVHHHNEVHVLHLGSCYFRAPVGWVQANLCESVCGICPKLWVSKTDPQTPFLSPSDLGQQKSVMFLDYPKYETTGGRGRCTGRALLLVAKTQNMFLIDILHLHRPRWLLASAASSSSTLLVVGLDHINASSPRRAAFPS